MSKLIVVFTEKVRVQLAKLGGIADAVSAAITPSPSQENAIKLVTNLVINGEKNLRDYTFYLFCKSQEKFDLNCKKQI